MKYILSLLFCFLINFPAMAVGVDEAQLKDPVQEARAQSIMKQLRCLVCQNQSIVDSDADLAQDLRIIVRERVIAGDDDEQVLSYMTSRYGDWVLLKPPFTAGTLILWLSPILLLLVGAWFIYIHQRRRDHETAISPLNADEKKRLAQLLTNEDKA
ncbi:MAG: cytochrome c-type biogenesis protein CcmH [Proteobacteria bacterium]|jgi:cytochrome c-type biogenesis protein CcmH|nr:cytochrome c-type biogenesis protein CcmH [Pseudomonadota bacterium]